MKTPLDKKTYIKLAEAYCKQDAYEYRVRESINIAIKQDAYMSIGLPTSSAIIMYTVSDILGDEFAFFFYDCSKSFKKYNSNVTLEDGSHPDVKDFGDLWEFENELHEETQ